MCDLCAFFIFALCCCFFAFLVFCYVYIFIDMCNRNPFISNWDYVKSWFSKE